MTKRTMQMNVLLSDDEFVKLEHVAEQRGLRVSDMVRLLIRREYEASLNASPLQCDAAFNRKTHHNTGGEALCGAKSAMLVGDDKCVDCAACLHGIIAGLRVELGARKKVALGNEPRGYRHAYGSPPGGTLCGGSHGAAYHSNVDCLACLNKIIERQRAELEQLSLANVPAQEQMREFDGAERAANERNRTHQLEIAERLWSEFRTRAPENTLNSVERVIGILLDYLRAELKAK